MMRAHRRFLIAGCIAAFMLGTSAQARDCGCEIVLNGRLNTADFDGGVGQVVDYGGGGGGVFATGRAFASAFAFAHAQAFGVAFSHGVGMHGGHWGGGMHGGHWGGGMHGGFGGGHR